MKIYVITKARPFQPEQYVDVARNFKKAESKLRNQFPHMRKSLKPGVYSSDANREFLLFIHEEEVED